MEDPPKANDMIILKEQIFFRIHKYCKQDPRSPNQHISLFTQLVSPLANTSVRPIDACMEILIHLFYPFVHPVSFSLGIPSMFRGVNLP